MLDSGPNSHDDASGRLSANTDPKLSAAILKGIVDSTKDNWRSLRGLLVGLKPSDKIANGTILNQNLYTLPILHALILRNAPTDIFERIIDLGADPDIIATEHNRANRDKFNNFSPLMMALHTGELDYATILLNRGCNREGALKLAITLDSSEDNPRCTKLLLSRGEKLADLLNGSVPFLNLRGLTVAEDFAARDLSNANLIDTDLSGSDLTDTKLTEAVRSPGTKFPRGFNFRDPALGLKKARPHPVLGEERYVSDRELEREFNELSWPSGPPPQVLREAYGFREQSLSDGVLYLAAFNDAVKNYPNSTGLPFTTLLPRILFNYPNIAIPEFLREFERRMDQFYPPARHHKNTAELLALCAHPRDPGLQSPLVDKLGTAITSIDRWIAPKNWEVPFTDANIALFGKIGILTHSHLWFKYATQRERTLDTDGNPIIRPALIESFGARFVEDNATKLGARYVFSPNTMSFSIDAPNILGESEIARKFRSDMYVEFRRGYYMLSDPEYGTHIIRNSSPDFGRDKLPGVAFWSPFGIDSGFNMQDLLDFKVSDLLDKYGFRHITDPALYGEHPRALGHMMKMDQNLLDLIEHFNRWTFDTSLAAWQYTSDGRAPVLVGGHRSKGFPILIDFLENRLRANLERSFKGESLSPLPALAVMPRQLPWWAPYPLTPELPGSPSKYQIPVTLEVIEVLRSLQREEDANTPDHTGVLNLLQRAFDVKGVLALVNPEVNTDW
jgi:hypothetical protein